MTWALVIVRPGSDSRGFKVQAKRWIAERTFAWLGRHRRLVNDNEGLPGISAAWIRIAMIGRMLHRLYAA